MQLSYPDSLPVCHLREEIIEVIKHHQVVIILGETGSGKTTQLPKMCLEAGLGAAGTIGCTQPRRIAAIAVSDRVGEELQAPDLVAYKIRFHDKTSDNTIIKFMTDGVLLAETRQDSLLAQYGTLIVDEAHERSLNIDFLLGYLKNLLPRRPDLKLIISSATIDAEKFSRHFDDAPILSVSGRSYPIRTMHQEPAGSDENEDSYVEQAVAAVTGLANLPEGGDMLVFMPTERDINDTLDSLRPLFDQSHLLLPLYGRLPAPEQRKIFRPSHQRKIIVATNVAETSITVPGIRFVVDTGLARISRYNPRTGTTNLQVSRIAKASCDQRRGRCGRTGPGICVRLYSEEDYLSRDEFTLPEIQRANLAEVILQMVHLKLGDPAKFPFIDPPPSTTIREGYRTLRELGALADEHHLTARGRLMAKLPLDPRISRILVEGLSLNARRETTILAAALSIGDPRIRPPEKEFKADEAHRQFVDKQSDFLTLLNIWNHCFNNPEEHFSKSRLSRLCKTAFLSWQRMREWMDVHEQIDRLLRVTQKESAAAESASYEAVHKSLASGFLRNICQKKEKNTYLASGNKEVILFPGSGLYNKGPQWAVAAEFIETTQLFARTVAAVDPSWLEQLGGDLCKRSWSEPHWEKKQGKVLALERVTLFGLTLVAGRKVEYGRINDKTLREAREIFIRSALVEQQLGGRYAFMEHNAALIEQYQQMEERLRRRDIVVDPETLYAFYDARLGRIYDRFTLNRLLRNKKDDLLLRMTEADICLHAPDSNELYQFPATVRAGDFELELSYMFHPGDEADGVSVRLPYHLIGHLNPHIFEWLVPGLLPEKLLLLLKKLPKILRRRLVPLPDAVDRIMDSLVLYQGSLYQELDRVLLRLYQITVRHEDWQADSLPAHLRMRFVLIDEHEAMQMTSRSFRDLQARSNSNSQANAPVAEFSLPPVREITAAELDTVAKQWPVTDKHGKTQRYAYPVLEADEVHACVRVRYIDNLERSKRLNRMGLQLLYGQCLGKEMTVLRRLCKEALASHSASWLSLGSKLPGSELRAALQAFLLDAVLQTRDGALPSSEQFNQQLVAVQQQGLLRTLTPVLNHLLEILHLRRQMIIKINQWRDRAKKSRSFDEDRHQEYLHTLEAILPATVLDTMEAADLKHTVRYLQALALRLERAEHDPQKDRGKAEKLRVPLERLQQFARFDGPTGQCLRLQREYHDLVQEYRVSLFAPELGTAQPVSEQRLHQKWQELEACCRRIE